MFLYENTSTAVLTEQVTSNQMTSAHNTVLQNVYGTTYEAIFHPISETLRCV